MFKIERKIIYDIHVFIYDKHTYVCTRKDTSIYNEKLYKLVSFRFQSIFIFDHKEEKYRGLITAWCA